MSYAIKEAMKDEFTSEIAKGYITLDEIRQNSPERIAGYLPTYNHDISKQWSEMPNDYTDRGAQELGSDGSIGIIGLMSLDLYLYYTDLFNEVMAEMESGE